MAYSEIFHLLIKFSLVYIFFSVDQRGQTKKKILESTYITPPFMVEKCT